MNGNLERVFDKTLFTARFARDAKGAERIYVFFSVERPEKKRSYSVMAVKIAAVQIRTRL